jgi:hypothetical protein
MIKIAIDLISGKAVLHKHQDIYDIFNGNNDVLWNSIDIDTGTLGFINLGRKTEFQGFVLNYIMKVLDNIQYGRIHVMHNDIVVTSPPYHEFYFAGREMDISFTAEFDGDEIHLDIENNDLDTATFKYIIVENIQLL